MKSVRFACAVCASLLLTVAAEETELKSGDLVGTYLDAGENAPLVLIVPGSGPTNRDGNSPLGVAAGTYKLLAEGLAARGISTVRVDKRGMFSSAAAGDPNQVSVEIYAADYRGWIDTIKAETGAGCVYLLGHSEGALMVSAAAVGRDDVCGLILVSGTGRPFGQLLREQLRANPANAPILPQALDAIGSLEAGERVDTDKLHPALLGLFAKPVQNYLISLMRVDPAEMVRRAGQKTLVVHGETDIQTSVEDAELLAAAAGTEAILLPGINHILKQAPADRARNVATYTHPDLPIAPSVVEVIAGFILGE